MAQLVLPWQSGSALRREDFIVGDANREAVAFVDAYPDWPAPAAALYGPAQSGKSHLVSAWAARAGGHVVDAAKLGEAPAEGPLAVEDVDRAEPDERAIFAVLESGRPVLFTAERPPAEWHAALPDLRSRYGALLAFALWAPDEALLEKLARKLFADRQLAVPDAVVAHMIKSLERSPAAIRDFVARADDKALSEKRNVTLGLIRDMLER
ncbi:MAG: hypothetical protein JOZ72_03080 [Alphaproteobacteria bacterium]|nr:hypothetical protein [Alphaproteobacteria bacterium]